MMCRQTIKLAGADGLEPSSLGSEPSIIYRYMKPQYNLVEPKGVEPFTFSMPLRRSTK